MAYTVDTVAEIERIQDAGASPALARAIVTALNRADERLVTKSDLDAAIANLERRLIIAGAVGLGLLFTLLRFTA